jgi:hypothetical protein
MLLAWLPRRPCGAAVKSCVLLLVAAAGVELPSVDYDYLRNALIDNCDR